MPFPINAIITLWGEASTDLKFRIDPGSNRKIVIKDILLYLIFQTFFPGLTSIGKKHLREEKTN